jgi:hypothetical protein
MPAAICGALRAPFAHHTARTGRCSIPPPALTAPRQPRRVRAPFAPAAAARRAAAPPQPSHAQSLAAAACGGLAAAAVALLGCAPPAAAAAPELVEYANAGQSYRMSVPAGWERKDKAGADVLFEDPERRWAGGAGGVIFSRSRSGAGGRACPATRPQRALLAQSRRPHPPDP